MGIYYASLIDSVIETYHDLALYAGGNEILFDRDLEDFINNQIIIPVNIPNFIVDLAGKAYQVSAIDPIKSILDYHQLVYIQAATNTIKNPPVTQVW
ncbi:hypothetical protein HMPREF3291_01015 [Bacillus sp. HMSC76G11]|nr:hypothetical protein HMPREF3291_01015 [Bacillus sp. HMSC76G11]